MPSHGGVTCGLGWADVAVVDHGLTRRGGTASFADAREEDEDGARADLGGGGDGDGGCCWCHGAASVAPCL